MTGPAHADHGPDPGRHPDRIPAIGLEAEPSLSGTAGAADVPDLVSYQVLRRVVGLQGILLPPVLAIAGLVVNGRLEPSISEYYATPLRDVLVGVLFVIGWFLYTYHGYDEWDNRVGNLAGALAIGVALFPATDPRPWVTAVHFVCAGGLFLLLAYFAFFLFTKGRPHIRPTPRKRIRNRIYRTCGLVIVLSMASIGVLQIDGWGEELRTLKPVFFLEAIALWAFGFSWFVKSEAILRDRSFDWQSLSRL